MNRRIALIVSFVISAAVLAQVTPPIPTGANPKLQDIRPPAATGAPKLDLSHMVPTITWESELKTGSVAPTVSATFHGGKLLMVYRSRKNETVCENVYGTLGGAPKWLGETQIANHSSPHSPGIVGIGDRAVMVHAPSEDAADERMRMSVRVDEHWSNAAVMWNCYLSRRSPVLAADDTNVYLVYSSLPSNELKFDYCPINAEGGTVAFTRISNIGCGVESAMRPGLASFKGSVYLAYRAAGNSIWYSVPKSFVANHKPPVMIPGIEGRSPQLVRSGKRLFLFFITPNGRRIGYSTYNGERWNEFRYLPLSRPARDMAIAVQEKLPDTFHLLYTSLSDMSVYHLIGRAK